jgi:aspartyl/asparaginyl beta-hydroxylase (cupin superfamily)
MFLTTSDFPFTATCERNWQAIRAEYEVIPSDRLLHWPERSLYDFGWRAFPMIALGQRFAENAALCPKTMNVLRSIPKLVNAGFSLFESGTHVQPHVGYTSSVYRFHLGLKIPETCGLRVGDQVRCWEEGKLLGFDDMVEHSAWNDSVEHRVVLLFDVLRPGAEMEITPSAMQAVQDYLDALQGAR